ncbi:RING finger domain-containing protein [Tetraselmis virus 1]|uniref:RING finger domain-containing protein n=1 Tax=Tetraselmis virus 1 TaxID=2060617 RepID=A0A2P0VMJ0_9VIRU|nr:RING finger domain-containing protein [Tetraselmis virus 1]AUF82108.1 RING finger domain-containing protein [Tetraselmis virus 1]
MVSGNCLICFEDSNNMMLAYPCGHICCCKDCISTVSKCPVCRKDIKDKIRPFLCQPLEKDSKDTSPDLAKENASLRKQLQRCQDLIQSKIDTIRAYKIKLKQAGK